ncbi:E3 ubiquitin-protein ligase MIB2-like, partial [Saccostrea cucullata]|uniref:E3 ubiquitin-protein ligase MIB2-like n=1 Tax=Saccostrea cuccullata TaxID=36930 RepID=UPI002ED50FEA
DAIYELIRNKARIMQTQERREDDEERWYKEKFSTIPKLGTRVRRGPHWRFQNQDSEGIGTIVGHGDKAGLVLVEWDNGERSMYNYGIRGMYDVVVCEESRVPLDGLVAVGCFVKRGSDWKWGDQDGGEEAIGTCYRVMDNATVYIRWPCGRMGKYRFGYDGKYDIELCDPFSPEVIKTVIEQQNASNKSGTITEHMVASNDLKDKSVIKETPHNTTK